ncbi:hypothetical protein VOLCADRAFT_104317 [Volvox carteri f. nagariensis]|uniref:Uncharacterized protein n=1 Tax=Volvox carteri f. nagariensis TaxID=3068 RepID=D8TSU2_VOLCA|nr:uncharacterized protein VOLCADRAFT_104317 [Volvox carteri f. nagariensis]EFJ49436.1 hypothetical protein VOLCADRAFT_104317 [Volvox carteri f. nagariensis]|eukprot:XP_002949417.1 hypothetical protein VOLCADRAFT_104317 [Volvox carteri f. nagariensis]
MSSGEVLGHLYDCIQEARSAQLNVKYLSWKYAHCIALHPNGEQLQYKDLTAEAPVSSKAVHIWDITYKKEGSEPFCLSRALGSVVKKHIFKDYLIQGAKEHVLRTCGSSYNSMDLDTKIGMVKAELEKAPKPLPGQIGYKYGAKYFWPQRPWVDELKRLMKEKDNMAKSAGELKQLVDLQSQQQTAAATAPALLISTGAVNVRVAASNQPHTAAMPAAVPMGAVTTAAVDSSETLEGKDVCHGPKWKNMGTWCQSASLGTGGAAVAAANAGLAEGEVFNPVDDTPSEDLFPALAAELAGPVGVNKSKKRKLEAAETVLDAAEKVGRMGDDSMEDDSNEDEYVTIENTAYSVDTADDVPAALAERGLAILHLHYLKDNVKPQEVEMAILFAQQNATAIFQDIPLDEEGNFIPERDENGRKEGMSDYGTRQWRQVIINSDDHEEMLKVFRVLVEVEMVTVQLAMESHTLHHSSPAILINRQAACQKPVSRQCWHTHLSEGQTGFVVIAAVQKCSLLVFPGSHKQLQEYWRLQQLLKMDKIGEATFKACLSSNGGSFKAVRINLDLGDILFMSGHTIHAGGWGIDKHPALCIHWYVTEEKQKNEPSQIVLFDLPGLMRVPGLADGQGQDPVRAVWGLACRRGLQQALTAAHTGASIALAGAQLDARWQLHHDQKKVTPVHAGASIALVGPHDQKRLLLRMRAPRLHLRVPNSMLAGNFITTKKDYSCARCADRRWSSRN